MNSYRIIVIGVFFAISGPGCGPIQTVPNSGALTAGSAEATTASPSPSSSPSPTAAAIGVTPPADSALYLQVDSVWQDGTGATTALGAASCHIPSQSPGVTTSCTAYVPAAQLYFSKLTFTVGTNAALPSHPCAELVFRPYFYVAAYCGSYFWFGTRTCPASGPPIYGGVAQTLIDNFPVDTSLVTLLDQDPTGTSVQKQYTMSESTAQAAENGSANAGFNMPGENNFTVNTLTNRAAAWNGTWDAYVGNAEWQDYSLTCYDKWGENLYTINLTVSDNPTASGYEAPPAYAPNSYQSPWE